MPRNDFNGDGRSDVLWLLGGDSAVSNWLGTAAGGFVINDVKAFNHLNAMHTFRFNQTGDFNGDGRTDILWLVDPGPGQGHSIWFSGIDGGSSISASNKDFTVSDLSWRVVGAADFNGDGVDDLLWRNANGTMSNWLGSASGNFAINDSNARAQVSNDWHIAGTGDFNGDGRSDILWQNDSGLVSNWLGTSRGGFVINDVNALTSGFDGRIVGIGNFNGDDRDDLVYRDKSDNISVFSFLSDGSLSWWGPDFMSITPAGWDIVAVGDYNGDGGDDLLWRNDNGAFSNWLANSTYNGTGAVDFEINDRNAFALVPVDWQVAESFLL